MKILKALGDLVSPNDPELVEKTLARIAEQDTWNDVFSTKLIELLDNIDLLKSEHRQKLRAIEALVQKASASLERAEGAHKRASDAVMEAKRTLDESSRQFERAHGCAAEAERQMHVAECRLESSEHNLQRACELQRSSEEKHREAVKLFRGIIQYSAWAVAVSWAATVWFAWLTFRPGLPVWVACIASLLLLVAAVLTPRLAKI
jgi:hypothetical protein